jgi:hypothetical protein
VRKEFGGGVGLSVLSLWLVPWRIQVLSKHLVYIVHQDHDTFDCSIHVLEGVEY